MSIRTRKLPLTMDPKSSNKQTNKVQVEEMKFLPKFKEPMKYELKLTPLKTKEELWKAELGLSDYAGEELFSSDNEDSFTEADQQDQQDKRIDLELRVLQKEIAIKDEQKEKLMLKIKTLESDIKTMKKEESLNRSKIKITKLSFEKHLDEKRRFIEELQTTIEHFENNKQNKNKVDNKSLIAEFCGEIERLQGETKDLNEKLLLAQNKVETQELEIIELQKGNTFENGQKQPNEQTIINGNLEENKKVIDALRKENIILKTENTKLHNLLFENEEKYSANEILLKEEFIILKKRVAESENKYNDLMSRSQETFQNDKVKNLSQHNESLLKEVEQFKNKYEEKKIELSKQNNLVGKRLKEKEMEVQSREEEIDLLIQEFKVREETLIENHQEEIQKVTRQFESELEARKTNYAALIKKVFGEMQSIRREKQELFKSAALMVDLVNKTIDGAKIKLFDKLKDSESQRKLLGERYRRETLLRKKLHNELIEVRGNIRVFCRVRPPIREDGKNPRLVVEASDGEDGLVSVEYKTAQRAFHMDKVFGPETTQSKVFGEVSGLVTSCLDGYNVCIFAYGQTGSGKTYSMEGTPSNPGINQQALNQLFKEIGSRGDWNYQISVSHVEIYNETLKDLLADHQKSPKNKGLEIRINNSQDGVHVPGLSFVEVKNTQDVNKVLTTGNSNRATASHNLNEHSSRSHSVLAVTVEGRNQITNTNAMGKLNLVDLAGSERISRTGSNGKRMKETQNINTSLSALTSVISALRNKSAHVPYRNSKLTYLLQDSLGGNSKTLVLVQVSPVENNAAETVCSMTFAERIRSVQLGPATRKLYKTEYSRGKPRGFDGDASWNHNSLL